MVKGKVSEAELNKTIIKNLTFKRDEISTNLGVGKDYGEININSNEKVVIGTAVGTMNINNSIYIAITKAINNLVTSKGTPIGIITNIILPKCTELELIKKITLEINKSCEKYKVQVLSGHTELSENVNCPIITVTAIGKINEEASLTQKIISEGQEIVLTKHVAIEGTGILAKEKYNILCEKFSKSYVDIGVDFIKNISVMDEVEILANEDIAYMHDLSYGGIYAALWEMSSAIQKGFEVYHKQIPIKQETVEICEFFDINPYMLCSSGSMLIVCNNGNRIVNLLQENGINSAVIGRIENHKNKTVINGDENRFLGPQRGDELNKIL